MNLLKHLLLIILITTGTYGYPNMQKASYTRIILPVFNDSTTCTQDFSQSIGIRKVYEQMKKENEYMIYSCHFIISQEGTVILDSHEVNNDIENFLKKFSNYKWKPGFKQGCTACKVVGYGNLYLDIIPQRNMIRLSISVGDGSLNLRSEFQSVYLHTLKM
jgi:hypothetical protein